jgi:hypothetical protein
MVDREKVNDQEEHFKIVSRSGAFSCLAVLVGWAVKLESKS